MKKLNTHEIKRISADEYSSREKRKIIVLLDNIRSLNNIGSFFRTCDAFLVEKILLSGVCGTPPNNEIHKTALGAEEIVEWEYYENPILAIEKYKLQNYKIIAIEQAENSTMLQNFKTSETDKLLVVFGNEVFGVSDELMNLIDDCIEIPQYGTKHSLNVSVSAGIVLWHLTQPK